jgi:hypothetical protein
MSEHHAYSGTIHSWTSKISFNPQVAKHYNVVLIPLSASAIIVVSPLPLPLPSSSSFDIRSHVTEFFADNAPDQPSVHAWHRLRHSHQTLDTRLPGSSETSLVFARRAHRFTFNVKALHSGLFYHTSQGKHCDRGVAQKTTTGSSIRPIPRASTVSARN